MQLLLTFRRSLIVTSVVIDATTVVVVEITELVTGHHYLWLVSHHGGARKPFQVRIDGKQIATGGASRSGNPANVVRVEEIPGGCLMMMVVVVMLGRRWLVDAQRIGRHDRPAQVSIKLLNAFETSRTAASLLQGSSRSSSYELKSAPGLADQ